MVRCSNNNNHTRNDIITNGIIHISNRANTINIVSNFGQTFDCVVSSTSFSVIGDNMGFNCDQTHGNRDVLRICMQITGVKCTHTSEILLN